MLIIYAVKHFEFRWNCKDFKRDTSINEMTNVYFREKYGIIPISIAVFHTTTNDGVILDLVGTMKSF